MKVCGLIREYDHESLTSNNRKRGGKAGRLWHSGIMFDGGKGITVAGVLQVQWGFLFCLRCLLQTLEVQLFVVREIYGACSPTARRGFALLCITFKDLCRQICPCTFLQCCHHQQMGPVLANLFKNTYLGQNCSQELATRTAA